MNELFVNVKVDREERPDVDAIYMDAVVALSGHGGWPMTVFLTPDGEPFCGGTYFPPVPRKGMPAFRDVLRAMADAYASRRGDVDAAGRASSSRRSGARARSTPSHEPLTTGLLDRGGLPALHRQFDPRHGGFGGAPKFPPGVELEFLLRTVRAQRRPSRLSRWSIGTLDAMAAGGIYDQLGGGFHRYAVDAHLARAALREDALRQRAARLCVPARPGSSPGASATARWSRRRSTTSSARCCSRREASPRRRTPTRSGEEGTTYVWTLDELHDVLEPDEADARRSQRYGVTARRELRGLERPLRRPRGRRLRGGARRRSAQAARRARRGARSRPATTRRSRPGTASRWPRSPRPGCVSDAARLPRRRARPRGVPARDHERRAAGACTGRTAPARRRSTATSRTTRTSRTACSSSTRRPASCATSTRRTGSHGWRSSSSATPRAAGSSSRRRTASSSSRARRSSTTTRRRPATRCSPSCCSASPGSTETTSLERRGRRRLPARAQIPRPTPRARSAHMLCALDLHFAPPREVAIVGPPDDRGDRGAPPRCVRAVRPRRRLRVRRRRRRPGGRAVPLLAGKGLVDGRPAAYVCQNFACQAPVTEPEALVEALAAQPIRRL